MVECVSYCVCGSLGLDTTGYSAPYVAGWGGEDALQQLEACARLIDRLAGRIEEAVLASAEESLVPDLSPNPSREEQQR